MRAGEHLNDGFISALFWKVGPTPYSRGSAKCDRRNHFLATMALPEQSVLALVWNGENPEACESGNSILAV